MAAVAVAPSARLVVRNTFLEVDEQDASPAMVLSRRFGRYRTDSAVQGMRGALAELKRSVDVESDTESEAVSQVDSDAEKSDSGSCSTRCSSPARLPMSPEPQERLRRHCQAEVTPSPALPQVSLGHQVDRQPSEWRTTVMLRNLPNNYTRRMILEMIDGEGFEGQYDFVYLPMDFKRRANLGYCFVNMVHPSLVAAFWDCFEGYSKFVIPTSKASHMSWGEPTQGLAAVLERFRNSPVMHPSVPEEYKPLLFSGGVRIAFPAPTRPVRPPQLRK